MFPFRSAAVFFVLITSATSALAHEFWISPDHYQIAPGEQVTANLRVGQNFEGPSFSYMPQNFVRFEIGAPAALASVDGRMGDRPAVVTTAGEAGLLLVVHETTDSRLTYSDWSKFTGFVERHDLGNAIAQHAARGIPETGFRESYRRFAKSLLGVGEGAGLDQHLGLDVEIVAETNPYTLPDGAPMVVRMYQDGLPRKGAQLEIFQRQAGEVTYNTLRSDADGRVLVPVTPGSEVMLNFVVLTPLDWDPVENGPAWRSLWASMTFAVPG